MGHRGGGFFAEMASRFPGQRLPGCAKSPAVVLR